ncbi:MAG: hypothetical protein ACOCW2_00530 [Chitinivibrionales bacterium]
MAFSKESVFSIRTMSESAIDPIAKKALEPLKENAGAHEIQLIEDLRKKNRVSEYSEVIKRVNRDNRLSDADRLLLKYVHAEKAPDVINTFEGGYAKELADNVKNGFGDVKGGFDDVKDGFGDIKDGFTNVNGGLADLKNGFDDLKGGFSNVKSGLSDLRNELNDIKGKFDDIKGGLDGIKGELNAVTGAITAKEILNYDQLKEVLKNINTDNQSLVAVAQTIDALNHKLTAENIKAVLSEVKFCECDALSGGVQKIVESQNRMVDSYAAFTTMMDSMQEALGTIAMVIKALSEGHQPPAMLKSTKISKQTTK